MKYLLDTHILPWAIRDESKLSSEVSRILSDSENHIYISIVSEWEIVIKASIGKLQLNPNLKALMDKIDQLNFLRLNLERGHLINYENLPLLHRDPFDRLLIAQAKFENLSVITSDANFKLYDIGLVRN
jgi:PIN domain nuclease of toxin-antitoxin system